MFTSQKLMGAFRPDVRVDAVAEYDWEGNNTGSVSFTYTGESQVFIAAFGCKVGDITRNISSCTFDGVSGTKIIDNSDDGGSRAHISFYIWDQSELPGSTGNRTLTPTWTNNPLKTCVGVWSLSFVDQTTPTGNTASADAAAALALNDTISLTITDALGKFVITGIGCGDSNSCHATQNFDPPASMTEDFDIGEALGGNNSVTGGHDSECASNSEVYTWVMKSTQGGTIDAAAIAGFSVNKA